MAQFPEALESRIQQDSMISLDQRHVVVQYGNGYEQRASFGVNSQFDAWNVRLWPCSKAELDTFIQFFRNQGFIFSWDWQPPEYSESKKWVFASQPEITNEALVYEITFDIRQVFE